MKKKVVKNKIDATKLDAISERVFYVISAVIIVGTLVYSIVGLCVWQTRRGAYASHIFQCALAFICMHIPMFLKKKFSWYIPSGMHIFILIFILAHFILGEVIGTYKVSAIFDKLLHTTSGVVIALIGFSLINILNDSNETYTRLSPFFVAVFSFCFAIMAGVMWELFEYFMDSVFKTNMQRYIPPSELVQEVAPKQGYGLLDTMNDLLVSTLAALGVSVFGFLALKFRKSLLNRILIRKIISVDEALDFANENADKKFAKKLERLKQNTTSDSPKSDVDNDSAFVSEESTIEVVDESANGTSIKDTSINDTGINGTGINDTGINDTGIKDTSIKDTSTDDVGADCEQGDDVQEDLSCANKTA